jgi:hypothetical protein
MLVMPPRKLPVVDLGVEGYFFDFRLSQLRKVSEPHEFRDLSPGERKDFLEALSYLEVARKDADDSSSRIEESKEP